MQGGECGSLDIEAGEEEIVEGIFTELPGGGANTLLERVADMLNEMGLTQNELSQANIWNTNFKEIPTF